MNNVLKLITHDGSALVHIIDSTEICRHAQKIHNTSATASAALGRLLTGCALMWTMSKNDDDKITLGINGGGPAGNILAVCDSGHVRGYLDNPEVDLPENSLGKLDVGGLVGRDGQLSVLKSNIRNNISNIGKVDITSGEIAEDITSYYVYSEQIPTACALGVFVDTDLSVKCAGGFLLQTLPGVTETFLNQIETNLAGLKPVTSMLDSGMSTLAICNELLSGIEYEIIGNESVEYKCGCSRENMASILTSLGSDELKRLIKEQDITETVCNYCNAKYEFTAAEMSVWLEK